jgi:DNA (cytosine-5)-methyltransferase 1
MTLRYLSVCSGIEAATQAWHPLGWVPVAFSEIEAFPSAVLAHHYPHVPNWGDMTKFQDWPHAAIDVLCGGTPCQSFSVAGLRQGLADPRGNLMLTFGAIAGRYRPRWLVWENVPGVLSSNGGRDFGSFLGMLGQLGYGVAFRVLDAQYTRTCRFPRAVPQRRRRVFVVGHLGDWRRAAAVLFDRESLSGHPAPRRKAGQRPAPTISARPSGGGGLGTDFDLDGGLIAAEVTTTLDASYGRTQGAAGQDANHGHSTLVAFGGNRQSGPIEAATALSAHGGASGQMDFESETFLVAHALRGEGHDASEDGSGRGTPIIAIQERAVSENPEAGPDGVGVSTEGAAYTLEARTQVQAVAWPLTSGMHASASRMPQEQGALVPIAFSFKDYGNDATEEASPTLRSLGHYDANGGSQMAVAFDLRGREGGAMPEGPHDTANMRAGDGGSSRSYVAHFDVSNALHTAVDTAAGDGNETRLVSDPWAVRRLTPRECERLQGFPDGFTAIPWRGKPADLCPDGPRYKALGNSWAVNVAEWVGTRIAEVDIWGGAA